MTNDNHSSARRRFLLKAVGLSAAGLAVGGGGAWVKTRVDDGLHAAALLDEARSQLASASTRRAELELSSAALHTQVADLQTQLATALAHNAELSTLLSASQKESADLQQQLASTRGQLSTANDQVTRLQELTRLYGLLEGVGLDSLAQSGLAAAAGGLAAVLGLAPTVRNGLARSRDLLTGFEQALPDLNDAMTWLGEQVINLRLGLYAVEIAAQRTLNELITGLEATLGKFVKFILDRLPFNIGADVRRTLTAMQTLLTGLPGMADGVNEKVLAKVSRHVSDGPQNWRRTLVAPLREEALTPTDSLLNSLVEADLTFSRSLKAPLTAALERRAALREQIAAYRAAHNL